MLIFLLAAHFPHLINEKISLPFLFSIHSLIVHFFLPFSLQAAWIRIMAPTLGKSPAWINKNGQNWSLGKKDKEFINRNYLPLVQGNWFVSVSTVGWKSACYQDHGSIEHSKLKSILSTVLVTHSISTVSHVRREISSLFYWNLEQRKACFSY